MLRSKYFLNVSFPFSFNLLKSFANVWIFCVIVIFISSARASFLESSLLQSSQVKRTSLDYNNELIIWK